MARAYFNEIQRFRQWWVILIILVSISSWLFGVISSLNAPEAEKASSNIFMIGAGGIPLLLVYLMLVLRLETRIREDGIHFRFKPLQFKEKHIKPEDIERFEVRKYKPISEYGGWGYRTGRRKNGKAYNVSGNIGLQLFLKSGKKLLIGTQHQRGIKKAMDALMGVNS